MPVIIRFIFPMASTSVRDFRRDVGDVDVRRFGRSVFGSVVAGLINCVWAKVPDSVKIGDRGARYKQDEISRSVIQTIITLARRTFHFIITIFKQDVLNSTFCYRKNTARNFIFKHLRTVEMVWLS